MTVFGADGYQRSGSVLARDDYSFRHTGGSGIEMWYYAGVSSAIALTTGAPTANVLRALPFIAPARGGTLDRIAFNVTTLLAGNGRIGLYTNVSDSNLYPATLLEDSGSISTGTTGVKSYSISRALNPGQMYWLAYCSDAAATLRCIAVANAGHLLGVSNALGTAPNVGISVNHTYGALPSTFTAGGAVITAVPVPALAMRFSA